MYVNLIVLKAKAIAIQRCAASTRSRVFGVLHVSCWCSQSQSLCSHAARRLPRLNPDADPSRIRASTFTSSRKHQIYRLPPSPSPNLHAPNHHHTHHPKWPVNAVALLPLAVPRLPRPGLLPQLLRPPATHPPLLLPRPSRPLLLLLPRRARAPAFSDRWPALLRKSHAHNLVLKPLRIARAVCVDAPYIPTPSNQNPSLTPPQRCRSRLLHRPRHRRLLRRRLLRAR